MFHAIQILFITLRCCVKQFKYSLIVPRCCFARCYYIIQNCSLEISWQGLLWTNVKLIYWNDLMMGEYVTTPFLEPVWPTNRVAKLFSILCFYWILSVHIQNFIPYRWLHIVALLARFLIAKYFVIAIFCYTKDEYWQPRPHHSLY